MLSWIKTNTAKGSAGGAADPSAADGTGTRTDGTQRVFTEAQLKTVLSAVWVGGLFLPAGFWLRTRGDALFAGAVLAAGLIGAPALTSLLPTPAYQWAAAALGVLAGTGFNAVLSCHSTYKESIRSVLTPKL